MAEENLDYDTGVALKIAEAKRALNDSKNYSNPVKKKGSVVTASSAYRGIGELRLKQALNESGPYEVLGLLKKSIAGYTTARDILSSYESLMRSQGSVKAPDFSDLWKSRDDINGIIDRINRKKDEIKRKSHLPLEESLAVLSFVSLVGALITLSVSFTGNVIGGSAVSSIPAISGILFILGIVFLSLHFIREKKK